MDVQAPLRLRALFSCHVEMLDCGFHRSGGRFSLFLSLPKPLVTVGRTPITAGSRCASAQDSRCSLVSSDGRCLSDRELLRQMLRSQRFLHITQGEPCDLGFEKCSGATVSLSG